MWAVLGPGQVSNNQIGELHRLLAQTALSAAPGKPGGSFGDKSRSDDLSLASALLL